MARPENPLEHTSARELYRGSRIRERRRGKGLSLEKMASLLGYHPDALANVETNRVNPSKQMLSKIAELLEVPVEYFAQAPVHPRILRKRSVIRAFGSGINHGWAFGKAPQATSAPLHSALGQLTQKASSTSTRLNSPLSTQQRKILAQRLAALEKMSRNVHEEVCEIRAIVVPMLEE